MEKQIHITPESTATFHNNADFCVGTGRMGLAMQEEYQKQLGAEVVRLTLMLGLNVEEPVLRGAVEKLAGAELVSLRDALREQAAEKYPLQLQLGTVRGEEALESEYLI